jgi:hypothetical protein
MNRTSDLIPRPHRRALISTMKVGNTIELLEPRRFMSASIPAASVSASVAPMEDGVHVVVVKDASLVPVAISAPYIKSADFIAAWAARLQPTKPSTAPLFDRQDLFGQWTGTFRRAKGHTDLPLSVDFFRRQPVVRSSLTQAFTGAFDLSAMTGESRAVTTVTMSRQVDVRIVINGPSATTSFSGALSLNGQQIAGRYAVLINGRYDVGTFTLSRQLSTEDA